MTLLQMTEVRDRALISCARENLIEPVPIAIYQIETSIPSSNTTVALNLRYLQAELAHFYVLRLLLESIERFWQGERYKSSELLDSLERWIPWGENLPAVEERTRNLFRDLYPTTAFLSNAVSQNTAPSTPTLCQIHFDTTLSLAQIFYEKQELPVFRQAAIDYLEKGLQKIEAFGGPEVLKRDCSNRIEGLYLEKLIYIMQQLAEKLAGGHYIAAECKVNEISTLFTTKLSSQSSVMFQGLATVIKLTVIYYKALIFVHQCRDAEAIFQIHEGLHMFSSPLSENDSLKEFVEKVQYQLLKLLAAVIGILGEQPPSSSPARD